MEQVLHVLFFSAALCGSKLAAALFLFKQSYQISINKTEKSRNPVVLDCLGVQRLRYKQRYLWLICLYYNCFNFAAFIHI